MMQNCQALQPGNGLADKGEPVGKQNLMKPCRRCNACVKILAGSHPDVILVAPEGDVIKIAQVRELSQRLTFIPHEARARAVIFSDAQAMNVEAANALLKALEEPPPRTYFFLTAGQAADLLPTVVSRCQHVRFNPVSAQKIEHCLVHYCGLDSSAAELAAIIAEGSISKALALADRPSLLQDMAFRRKWLVSELTALPTRPLPLVLMFAQQLIAEKKDVLSSLETIRRFFRDATIVDGCPEKIASTDVRDAIVDMARNNSLPSLFSKMDAIADTEQAIRQHGNQRLALEAMSVRLADRAA